MCKNFDGMKKTLIKFLKTNEIVTPLSVSKVLNIDVKEATGLLFELLKENHVENVYREIPNGEWQITLKNLNHLSVKEIEVGFKDVKQ